MLAARLNWNSRERGNQVSAVYLVVRTRFSFFVCSLLTSEPNRTVCFLVSTGSSGSSSSDSGSRGRSAADSTCGFTELGCLVSSLVLLTWSRGSADLRLLLNLVGFLPVLD